MPNKKEKQESKYFSVISGLKGPVHYVHYCFWSKLLSLQPVTVNLLSHSFDCLRFSVWKIDRSCASLKGKETTLKMCYSLAQREKELSGKTNFFELGPVLNCFQQYLDTVQKSKLHIFFKYLKNETQNNFSHCNIYNIQTQKAYYLSSTKAPDIEIVI